MKIEDLSAKDLARIDAICLDYESKLRRGEYASIDGIVGQLGGNHAELLRGELEIVRAEVTAALSATRPPVAVGNRSPLSNSKPWSGELGNAVPKPGDQVGPYRLVQVLGRGGMGIVFLAIDTRLDRQVAIKYLAITSNDRASLADRFQREAKAIAKLSHPNIVKLFDVGVSGGVQYAVMEYLHGSELSARLTGQPLEPGLVRQIGAQIAEALAAAHSGGVIHRDLKPHNVMLVDRPQGDENSTPASPSANEFAPIVKLVDFGLARRPSDVAELQSGPSDSETRVGTVLGTPGYMAPEQARGEFVTSAADIFSLGCVLYEAFYGQRAFDGPTAAARFAAVLETSPSGDPNRRRVDPALASLIDRCLSKSPDGRPSSASEIAIELQGPRSRYDEASDESVLDPTTRRRFLESITGGFVGALSGHLLHNDHRAELGSIRSLAVVSLSGKNTSPSYASVGAATKIPIGERDMTAGEEIAGMLSQELQRVTNLEVRPYRPVAASTPQDFIVLGQELNVDAIVTGLYFLDSRGSKTFVTITLEMISARTGTRVWSETIVAEKAASLLEQTQLVGKLAQAINRRLQPPVSERDRPENVQALGCLAKGHTYLDPDNTTEGLEMAVRCFEHAISVDGRYPDAHAGLALTLVALATRGSDVEPTSIMKRIEQARAEYNFARELSPEAFDVRFAGAILDWQTYYRFQHGRDVLQMLASLRPNDWRVHYQLGLLQLSVGEIEAARSSLLLASQLNPQSIMVRTDRARLEWFTGNADRAVNVAKELLISFPRHELAVGLLIDIYEDQERYDAAEVLWADANAPRSNSSESYFALRARTIERLPYGPYNGLLNRAIFDSRVDKNSIDAARFEQLASSLSPALPILVSKHPAFATTKSYSRAQLLLGS